jgi:hypothetical protein
MKAVLALALVALAPTFAAADEFKIPTSEETLMNLIMRCPGISADGKHVVMFSLTAVKEKKAKTSFVEFDTKGKVEKRFEIVPPVVDPDRAKTDVWAAAKEFVDGGFKRMSVVAEKDDKHEGANFSGQYTSEDVVLDIKLVKRKLTIDGTRAGKKLATITKTLPKEAGCKAVDYYSLTNTASGFDPTSGTFAFQISASNGSSVCSSHEFVVPLK